MAPHTRRGAIRLAVASVAASVVGCIGGADRQVSPKGDPSTVTATLDCDREGVERLDSPYYETVVWGGGDDDQPYGAKITSPSGDVSAYRSLIPAFLDAGRIALDTYRQNQSAITAAGLHFMLPFGLAMARTRSIQLLHFPPGTGIVVFPE